MIRLRNTLILIQAQLWLLPGLMSAGALALAWLVLRTRVFELNGASFWWLYSGDAGTARDLLSSLLSGMITMTSLVVSMTFVILTLAANQLGPRLIRNFMADRQIQIVLGLFIGTILYTLLVLRSLNDTLGPDGVPHVAVTIASVGAIACLFALLFFVHKIARSIISDTVVEKVSAELRGVIANTLPLRNGFPETTPAPLSPVVTWVALRRPGYVQTVDYDALIAWAVRHETVLTVAVRPGHFVLQEGQHVGIHAALALDRGAVETSLAELRDAFVVGPERSPAQDLEYSIRQLVETALRALSPGINDPFTAMAAMDQLGAAMEMIALRSLQPEQLRDDDGTLRVVADRSTFEGLLDAAFAQIRQAGATQPAILIRLADTLGALAPVAAGESVREALVSHLDSTAEAAQAAITTEGDRQVVLVRIAAARAAIDEARQPPTAWHQAQST